MKTLTQHLEDYLTVRRSLGCDLAFTERVLRKFTAYADARGQRHVTSALFLAWRRNYGRAGDYTWSARLGMVRGFAAWLQTRDERTEVPPTGLISARSSRSKPYIYSPRQLEQLVAAAGRLPSAYGLRGLLWQTLFGVIAVTGLRVNEALRLERGDVDLNDGLLKVRQTKNGRDRVVPLKRCAVRQLARYRVERDRLVETASLRFFIKEDGTPAGDCGARYNFALVSQQLGIREPQRFCKHGVGPRIHDLRHTFAVNTILDWFRDGLDIDREMYRLTAYLGHAKPEYTYWYIEAVPELMQLAAERAEERCREGKR